jgi:hypothetical protein
MRGARSPILHTSFWHGTSAQRQLRPLENLTTSPKCPQVRSFVKNQRTPVLICNARCITNAEERGLSKTEDRTEATWQSTAAFTSHFILCMLHKLHEMNANWGCHVRLYVPEHTFKV